MDDNTAVEKVLMHLAETRGQWGIIKNDPFVNGWLRRVIPGDDYLMLGPCPVHSATGVSSLLEAHEDYGFGHDVLIRIAAAADNKPGHDPILRTQMIEACGANDNR